MLDQIAATLGVDLLHQQLVSRYRTERNAWRELLFRLGKRFRIPGRRVANNPPVMAWPAALTAPSPTDCADDDYDGGLGAALASEQDAFVAAVELLTRELGATVLARTG